MAIPNEPRVSRSVGSDLAELIGRQLMLDVLDQMRDQPDHWVLVATTTRRTKIAPAQVAAAIAAVVARGWLETDTTFHHVRRVRLTPEGRALFGQHDRTHVIERPRVGRGRGVRRALRSRPMRAFGVLAVKD
jgi:DNA-binding MarR family transcriptional regulator